MLLSETKQQWDKSYNNALKFVESDPQKRNKLCEIYENPTYYAGYYLKSLIDNIGNLRSVPADKTLYQHLSYGNGRTLVYH